MSDSKTQDKSIITACIDGSGITGSVIDAAVWAGKTLDAPLKFLHVLEKAVSPVSDRSGAILPGSATDLLDELTALDEKRGKVAMELGKHMLEDAKARATSAGATEVNTHQRHGGLLDALLTCEPRTRLYVLGRMGEDHENHAQKLGAHLESVVRAIQTPVMVTVGQFVAPDSYMIAYDGSNTADKAIANIADTPVLSAMRGYVVMVGPRNVTNTANLERATALLSQQGHNVESQLLQGNVVDELRGFRKANDIGLTVMGAYGHSRVRDFFVGSNTSRMIRDSKVPLLLLR
ncbi:MAG: universal stress protein [Pseudomonadota bacterium]